MVLAGEFVDENDINDRVMKYISKAASETVTSSTALQNDDDLFATLTPGVWRIELRLTATGVSGGDLAVAWSNTGTMTAVGRTCHGPGETTADTDDGTAGMTGRALTSTVAYGITAVAAGVMEDLLIEVTATGVLQLRWAQATSNVTGTTLSASSRMFITKVEEWS